jgi:ketopantoate hydroxymethyltransferase
LRHSGQGITALTAYDYLTSRLLDETGIDVLLVGDFLGSEQASEFVPPGWRFAAFHGTLIFAG